jgi:hypothetical protein
MATDLKLTSLDLYKVLMFEAARRIEAMNFILSGGTKLSEGIVRELCYLQLRMLCEGISLGCLVAHGDIVEAHTPKYEKEWSAEKIIKRLETLNPHFFPQQAEFGPGSITANTKPNALKKDELLDLYNKCGGFLHRGTLKKFTRANPLGERINVPDIVNWTQKIEDLLGCHVIPLTLTTDETTVTSTMLLCTLRDATQNMDTTVRRLEMKRPITPDP